jgi:(4S)-4-hydroxy-5-phosphonooxypentane-2,3-dione isomerase
MIVRIVKLPVATGNREEFLSHFESVKNEIRNFDGCLGLELLQQVDEHNHIFTYSTWFSEEKLKAYLNSPLFKATWSLVKPLFAGKAEAWSLEKIITVEA